MKVIRVLVIEGDDDRVKHQLDTRFVKGNEVVSNIFGENVQFEIRETFMGSEEEFVGATKHSLIYQVVKTPDQVPDFSEIMRLTAKVDLHSNPGNLQRFEDWKTDDGSLEGLKKVMELNGKVESS